MKKIKIILFITLLSLTGVKAETTKDCFEGLNRATFKFNQVLDGAIFKPVASVYRALPSPIRSGTSNAMDNLSNLVTIPNNILQGQFKEAGENTLRLAINSTIGVLGIFDVANSFGFEAYEKEDYGQTLGSMGVKPGCYLVLPVLGPTTVRDTVGSLGNLMGGDAWYNITAGKDTQHVSDVEYWGSRGLTGIDFRAKNLDSIDNLEKNSMDFYASVRSLYLQDRERKILNSKATTETQNDGDWEEVETQ